MTTRVKGFVRRCALIPLCAIITGCGPRDDGRTHITFWAFGAEGEHVAKLIPGFSAVNPDIDVRVQFIPWNAAHEKLLTAFAGSSLPDVWQLGNTWIPEFTQLGAIEDLTPLAARSQTIRDSSYFPGIWDTNVMDSLLYGIPWYVDTRVMFYRTDLLAKAGVSRPPATWQEWFDCSARLKKRYPADYANFFSTNNEWAPPVILGLQMGSPLLKDRNTLGDFSGPEFTAAMRAFYRFFKSGWAPVRTAQIVSVYQAFAEGFFAMYITGPWYIGEFRNRLPDSLQGSWTTAPLPGPDSGIGTSLAGGSSLVIGRTSKHKEAAWRLIEYLSEPAVEVRFHELSGNLPPRRAAWRDERLAGDVYAKAFRDQLERVRPTPKVPEWERIATEMQTVAEQVARGTMSVDEAGRTLDRRVNAMLEKRRWMLAHGAPP